MKKNLLLCLALIAILYSPVAFAQEEAPAEEEPAFTLAGSIDTYARTSLGTMNSELGGYGPSSAFANLKGFSLGMANLIASYSGEKSGFVADLVFGPRGVDAVFNSDITTGSYSGQRIINQMYGYFKLSDAVTINLGQFNTYLGYEVISPTVNVNYSTSYLFSYGPFTHTGLRADFDLGGGLVAKLAIMNPTDVLEFNPVNTYTLGGQIGFTNDGGGAWLNFQFGDQDGKLDEDDFLVDPTATSSGSLFQIDLTTGWTLSDALYLGFNTSMQSLAAGEEFNATGGLVDTDADATSFFGLAVYPKLTLSESFALGLRGEYFSIKKGHLDVIGLDTEGDGSVIELTLSGNYKIGNLTLIPEFRIDSTSEDSFVDADNAATNSMMSLLMAAVYKF